MYVCISAGSIFDISKYRETCESLIMILSGIYDTFDDVDAKTQHRC